MHGAKCLNFYCYGPCYAFADGTLSENVPAQRALAARGARNRQSRPFVGARSRAVRPGCRLVLQESRDLASGNIAIQVERRNTYLGLTHDNYLVDFLDEPMVEQGSLGRYQVLHSSTRTSRVMRPRRSATGCTGRDTRRVCRRRVEDEYDQELPTLREFFGVRDVSVTKPKMGYREAVRFCRGRSRPRPPPLLPPRPSRQRSFRSSAIGETIAPRRRPWRGRSVTSNRGFGSMRSAKAAGLRIGFLPAVSYAKDGKPSASQVAVGTSALNARSLRPAPGGESGATGGVLRGSRGSQPAELIARECRAAGELDHAADSLVDSDGSPERPCAIGGIHQAGRLPFKSVDGGIEVTLPLGATDMLLLQ